MTEIRCKNCNQCLSKNVKYSAGMYYMNPDRPLEVFQETIKCQKCGAINEITLVLSYKIEVKIVNDPTIILEENFTKKNNLYSA